MWFDPSEVDAEPVFPSFALGTPSPICEGFQEDSWPSSFSFE